MFYVHILSNPWQLKLGSNRRLMPKAWNIFDFHCSQTLAQLLKAV